MKKRALAIVLIGLTTLNACRGGADGSEGRVPSGGSSRLSELLRPDDPGGYAQALEPRAFAFPEDHGPHPAYRNEWWYVTGNLDAPGGERFGFELTIFRFALAPGEAMTPDGRSSAWASNQVYIGHFAVTDVGGGRFHVAERYSRGAAGLAGARTEPLRIWLENWHLEGHGADTLPAAQAGETSWQLYAEQAEAELALSLVPQKAPVLNGRDGLSQKSAEPGNASYYYSVPRLRAEGHLAIAGERHEVSGLAWLDREWGSSALSRNQEGWDWFALQLSDGSDLMFYQLRRIGGRPDRHSAGTFTDADGLSVRLSLEDVRLKNRDFWDSPDGGRYPMGWTLRIPRLGLDLDVEPVLEAQELGTSVRYWEGAVDVAGTRQGAAVGGRGYVELTGYAEEAQ